MACLRACDEAVSRWRKRNGNAKATCIGRSKPEQCARAEPGRKRSELAAGVYVDTPAADCLRYVARRSATGGFGWLLYDLALQGGLDQAQQVVVLGDGAPWIWNLVAEHFAGAVQIVDLYHAKEHVWDVAHVVFGGSSAAGTAWATHACSLLEQGQSQALVSAIKALPSIPPEPGHAQCPRAGCGLLYHQCPAHALSRLSRESACTWEVALRKRLAKPSSLPVPSAVACGFPPEGIDALLPLRTAVLNGTYDAFWEEYAA